MLTLGVDLASADRDTAACLIDWTNSPAEVTRIESPLGDELLLELIGVAHKTGIDVPLGWPDPFVAFIAAHHHGKPLPPFVRSVDRLRRTDHFVHAKIGRWPLSVAADRIAMPALRSAHMLARFAERYGPVDRTGAGRIVEVYPAAALAVWGRDGEMVSYGYKRAAGKDARKSLVGVLVHATHPWLRTSPADQRRCDESDHVLDALIAALVARVSALGLCEPIPGEMRDLAAREGWIALPRGGTLAQLAVSTQPPRRAAD